MLKYKINYAKIKYGDYMKKSVFFLLIILILNTYCAQAVTLPVLLYHNITDTPGDYNPEVHISKELFEEHLNFLKENNYNAITFYDYYNYRTNGAILPENPVIITFDDGYISNYEIAYPLIKKYGLKATIFMVTNSSFYPENFPIPHFTYAHAKEMQESGIIEIESHSAVHLVHPLLTLNELTYNIRKSYLDLYFTLGKVPFVYAYPTGAYSDITREEVSKAGYKIQLTVQEKLNNDETPLDQIKRLNIRGDQSTEDLRNLIIGGNT